MTILDDETRADWLQLSRSDGIGPITFARLIARFGTAREAIYALPDLNGRRIKLADRGQIDKEIEKSLRLGARLIASCEEGYPEALSAIADPPPLITVRGPLDLSAPSLAIVGARNASAVGRRIASDLAGGLGDAGWAVVSGLARGIDGAAHLSSMRTGTVAVIAGGIDSIYPPEHAGLYEAISEHGAVVSEVKYGHTARAQDFPKRNRIVSGLSRGVIVVEAAERSGTLITARLANEQGREVFAVPGSPLDPRSAGTNRLIRQGARLIRHVDDVLEELQQSGGLRDHADAYAPEPDDYTTPPALRAEILSLLSPTPIHRDELVRETSAPVSQVADVLLDLVLEELVEETSGGRFARSTDSLSST